MAFPSSITLNHIGIIAKVFEDTLFKSINFRKKLPLRVKYSCDSSINLQFEIKNLNYCNLEESIFNVEVRAKEELKYSEVNEPVDVSHLQDTVYMDEMYSINASRFIGKS